MKKVLLILILLPTISFADYKMYFKNKGNIVIPQEVVTEPEVQNPVTESGYLTLVGESDITITASKTYSLDIPSGAFDGYVWSESGAKVKVINEAGGYQGRGAWISGWYATEDNNSFLYNQWLDVHFNNETRKISGFEMWPSKYQYNRSPYKVKIQYSVDNGSNYLDGETYFLSNNMVTQRKEFSEVLYDVTNIRFFIFENHGNMDTLEVDELQFF